MNIYTLHLFIDFLFLVWSAAMLKLAEMEYNGANSIFLRLMLDKKYALPFRVLDALVAHFLSFRNDKRELPVLWHQSLLTLAQRYKADLASEQKAALLELLKVQTHPQISPEIRRELQNSASRDLETAMPVMAMDWTWFCVFQSLASSWILFSSASWECWWEKYVKNSYCRWMCIIIHSLGGTSHLTPVEIDMFGSVRVAFSHVFFTEVTFAGA